MSERRTTGKSKGGASKTARARGRAAGAGRAQAGAGAGTDWERLRRMTDAEAERAAAADPDNPPAEPGWLAAGSVVAPAPKQAISIRLDADVLAWFRGLGPRYQSRMNAVLRAYVEHQRRRPRAEPGGAAGRAGGR